MHHTTLARFKYVHSNKKKEDEGYALEQAVCVHAVVHPWELISERSLAIIRIFVVRCTT